MSKKRHHRDHKLDFWIFCDFLQKNHKKSKGRDRVQIALKIDCGAKINFALITQSRLRTWQRVKKI